MLQISRFLYHAMDDFWAECFEVEEKPKNNSAKLSSLQYLLVLVSLSLLKLFS